MFHEDYSRSASAPSGPPTERSVTHGLGHTVRYRFLASGRNSAASTTCVRAITFGVRCDRASQAVSDFARCSGMASVRGSRSGGD
ncbi:hypothetical protein BV898_19796 [Hypsibius exemplaris]|uniref:Uncharacterized protein n=1 Tax=Hypsibius exemplaris TaxID=2072580 RepID=A0A9X6NJL3_HYPEX|nr:hypothetical protein BV898_19796 [Hypsibius exemplaris]